MLGIRTLMARRLSRRCRQAKAGNPVVLRVEGLEDRLTPIGTAAGHWEGTLIQPGGPWQHYDLSYDLMQSGTAITGTQRIEVDGQPQHFGVRHVTGTVSNDEVILVDGAISSQSLPPGYIWLDKTVTVPLPPEVPSGAVDGTWSAGFFGGFFSGYHGTVHLRHTSAPAEPPALAIQTVKWVPLDQRGPGHDGQAAIEVTWASSNYTGPVTLTVYQSETAGVTPANGRIATETIPDAKTGKAVVYFSAPPVPGTTTKYIQVVAEGTASGPAAKPVSPVATLAVADTGGLLNPLSYELRDTAPVARTREERVQLWLEKYSDFIHAQARLRRIDPVAISGAIAWEALVNNRAAVFGLTGRWGPGKVHATEANGLSAAAQVERLGYLPRRTDVERVQILRTPEGAIRYIAAIMGAFADSADRVGAESLRRRPTAASPSRAAILTTLYQGISVEKYKLDNVPRNIRNSFLVPIRPGNADAYFRYKVRTIAPYQPNATMGSWVEANLDYLRTATKS